MDHRAGRRPTQQNKDASAGKTYLFGIGINTYEHWGNLNNAVRDVEAIANILQQNYGVTLWKLLRNEEATRKQILRALRALMKEVKAPDSIIIYYAGHGHIDKDTQLGAWVPTDGENEDTDLYIPNSTLRDYFQVAKAQHVLFISDACFSGSLLQEHRSAAEEMVLTELAARPSRWVMCSGRHDEAVADGPRGGHSPFAQAIIDELTHNQKQGLNAAALAQNVQLQSKQYYKDQLSDYGPVFNTGDKRGQLVLWRDGVASVEPTPEREWPEPSDPPRAKQEPTALLAAEPDPVPETMTLNGFKATVANFLAEDDTKAALEFMAKALDNESSDQNTIILLLSRLRRVGRQENVGVISHKDAATERNRINAAISNVADDIEEEDLRDDLLMEPSRSQPAPAPPRISEERELIALQEAKMPNAPDGFIYVEGGTFIMGCQEGRDSDCFDWEKPAHKVTLSSFYLSKYQVTQAQWREVMGSDPPELYNKGCDECPVEGVNWNDIQRFLQKLNTQTGQSYRLPTEAEWEYAARGGKDSKGYLYSGSNDIGEVAWCKVNAEKGNTYGSKKTTRPIGGKRANELGLYDMCGNVWEWCSDWFVEYENFAQQNPCGPKSGVLRITRGGSWDDYSLRCRAAYRTAALPVARGGNIGFRLAHSF
ncbi:SUMF1/EgtB/PvdO family nonheme iron enzyme [Lewinella cohaerens]|uniref:SUMF1/EgtB/PvdO family nonheme iron enzyme n=1 Tax=Lewinella cohaerens TaxID=70995 RepID=UPI00036DE970|nr:SUMF1/EgtB/PvdO family nonheme iron enzyme [Lewinella cohaerens]